jgi:polysaccharide pyruvyl transferase WcaK-like protein
VLWLPFHQDQDRGLLDQLDAAGLIPAALKERSRSIAAVDPSEAMGWFSSAALVIAMRLHGLILAALAGSPCAALSYDPKVAAAAAGLGCPWHDLALPPPADLAEQWIALADQAPDPAALEPLREGSAVHRTLLSGLAAGGSAGR